MMPGQSQLDEASLIQRVRAAVPGADKDEGLAARMVAAYQQARAARGEPAAPADIWFAISTDNMFRQHSIRLAEAQAGNRAPTFMYLFTWASPAFDGALGSCHALDLPFMFGNFVPPLGTLAGDGPEARALSEKMMSSWLEFARTGIPAAAEMPAWARYDAARRQTMVLGATCTLTGSPLEEERRFWASMP
jgi:para-nitrobenzyl esterase